MGSPERKTSIILHTKFSRRHPTKIHGLLCNLLPDCAFLSSQISSLIISMAVCTKNSLFKSYTNLPLTVRLQPGARVMYLSNDMYQDGVCNGTVGIVTHVDADSKIVRVAFISISHKAIIDAHITLKPTYFTVNGNQASRTQFPLQNCFALTVHKSQGLITT